MVVEGNGKRLAIECDGDRWHTQENLVDDMARQAILERLGWRFFRIRGSQFFRNPDKTMEALFAHLRTLDIPPIGMAVGNSINADGQELKERIIRRADVLRREWATSQGLSQQTNISNSTSAFPGKEHNQPSVQFKQLSATPVSTSLSNPKVMMKEPPQSAIRAGTATSTTNPGANGSPFNLIVFLAGKKLRIIDKRASGGCLWVIGGNELGSLMNELKARNILFTYAPNGGEATSHMAAWYTKYPN